MTFLSQRIFLLSLILILGCSAENKISEEEPISVLYTLVVSASEGGSVSTSGGTYKKGTEVTISATPNEGYHFIGWEGTMSTDQTLTITIDSNQTYLALFEVIEYQNSEFIPLGGNAYSISNGEKLMIFEGGIESWTNAEKKLAIYFSSAEESNCNLTIPIETNQNTITYSVSLNDDFFEIEVIPNKSEINLGIHTLRKGYNTLTLKGIETTDIFPKLTSLNIYSNELLSINYVKENSSNRFHYGRRGPSISLGYEFPENTNIKWMYSEIEVPEGYDHIGLFAMASGSRQSYFGIQVKSLVERWILFSVWSPYNTNNPGDVPADQQIQLLKSGEGVTIPPPFGGEGTGGQSYLIYPWKAGVKYSFLKSVEPDSNGNTIYTAYFKDPEEGDWRLIASFLRPKTDTWFAGPYSFLENFYPEEGYKLRKAYYGNIWALSSDEDWFQINNTRFTTDDIGSIQYRLDYQGGVESNKFYLMHCGFFDLYTENYTDFTKTGESAAPLIDFDLLP